MFFLNFKLFDPYGWKTKEHMGLANTNVLPMEMLGRMEHNSNADRCMAGTYGFLCRIFVAEVVRAEVRLAVVVSLRLKGAASGQAGSTRLDFPCEGTRATSGTNRIRQDDPQSCVRVCGN